jgi:hypothetical protein
MPIKYQNKYRLWNNIAVAISMQYTTCIQEGGNIYCIAMEYFTILKHRTVFCIAISCKLKKKEKIVLSTSPWEILMLSLNTSITVYGNVTIHNPIQIFIYSEV